MTDHANELRRYARKIAHPAGDVPSVMLAAADEIERLAARLEATEEDRSNFLVEMGKLCAQCDALRAKIERMERQEPVTAQQRFQRQQEMMAVWLPWQTTELRKGRPARAVDVHGLNVEYRELYALPGAQTQGEEK